MRILSKTHVGNVRVINEDSIAVCENKIGDQLLLVADGMGGHNAGDVASNLAKEKILEEFNEIDDPNIDYKKFIKESIEKANNTIYEEALINKDYSNMGTTLSFLIDTGNRVYIGHIGDSRIYYVTKKSIRQLTKDHTIVQVLYEKGQITKADLKTHPYRNVLTQSLGTNKNIVIDVIELNVPNKGYLMLCSDGLSEEVDDEKIHSILNTYETFNHKIDNLLNEALNNEGKDNISIILMERK